MVGARIYVRSLYSQWVLSTTRTWTQNRSKRYSAIPMNDNDVWCHKRPDHFSRRWWSWWSSRLCKMQWSPWPRKEAVTYWALPFCSIDNDEATEQDLRTTLNNGPGQKQCIIQWVLIENSGNSEKGHVCAKRSANCQGIVRIKTQLALTSIGASYSLLTDNHHIYQKNYLYFDKKHVLLSSATLSYIHVVSSF